MSWSEVNWMKLIAVVLGSIVFWWSFLGAIVYLMEDYDGDRPKGQYAFLFGVFVWVYIGYAYLKRKTRHENSERT